jgi:hypothetical protein
MTTYSDNIFSDTDYTVSFSHFPRNIMVRVVTSTIFDTSLCRYFRHFTGDPFSISAFSICISSPFQEYHQQIISNLSIALISESPTWAYSSLRLVVELQCGIHNSINYHYLPPIINQLNAINHPKESPPVLLQHLGCKRTLQAASHFFRPERRRLLGTWAPMMLDTVVQLVSYRGRTV